MIHYAIILKFSSDSLKKQRLIRPIVSAETYGSCFRYVLNAFLANAVFLDQKFICKITQKIVFRISSKNVLKISQTLLQSTVRAFSLNQIFIFS